MTSSRRRSVLITGATHGIGADIARLLAQESYRMALTGRDEAALGERVREITSLGGVVEFARTFDLADRASVESLADEVEAALGGVDVLVNNAGIGSREDLRPLMEFDVGFWDLTLAINLTAPFLLMRALSVGMASRGFGRIINIASINGRVPSSHSAAYVTSKHGLIGLTRVAALELAQTGVTVNAVCPGPVDVGDDRRLLFDAQQSGKDVASFEESLTPMGGRLVPVEIAPMVAFLASDAASAITGQSINVDRGMVMS